MHDKYWLVAALEVHHSIFPSIKILPSSCCNFRICCSFPSKPCFSPRSPEWMYTAQRLRVGHFLTAQDSCNRKSLLSSFCFRAKIVRSASQSEALSSQFFFIPPFLSRCSIRFDNWCLLLRNLPSFPLIIYRGYPM